MLDMFYNPNTMSNPGTILTGVHPVDMSDKFTKFTMQYEKPYADRKAAVSESANCVVYFYEDCVLYRALRIGSWQWKPCTDVECNPGINWHTFYAQTAERLQEYLTDIYGKLRNFKPRVNAYGLYEIQVHYDGICR